MKKVIRDGKVGVVISPGWGIGFHTLGVPDELVFSPDLIELIEANNMQGVHDYIQANYPEVKDYGINSLQVAWIPEGTKFVIEEYDGAEYIMAEHDFEWFVA